MLFSVSRLVFPWPAYFSDFPLQLAEENQKWGHRDERLLGVVRLPHPDVLSILDARHCTH